MRNKVLLGLGLALLVVAFFVGSFLMDDYQSKVDMDSLKADYIVIDHEAYWEISKEGTRNTSAVVMYGGGNVEPESYMETLSGISDLGFKAFIVKSPFNLAFFDMDGAEQILKDNSDIIDWVLMGHSLGGVAASRFASEHIDMVSGLILLASYPEESIDLSEYSINVLSISGSNDEVIDRSKILASVSQLPSKTTFVVIEGANHGQFGNYGKQDGDGLAEITREEQLTRVLNEIEDFFITIEEDKMKQERSYLKEVENSLNVDYIDQSKTVTFKAVGDIMYHGPQVRAGETENGYDFTENFEAVIEILSDADMTIGNLETTLSSEEKGYSGYPRFNTPDQALDAIKEAGFDVLSIANNHIGDRGAFGYDRTLSMIEAKELVYIGGVQTRDEQHFKIMDVNGLKVALIGATYETPLVNGRRTLNGSYMSEEIQDRLLSFRYDDVENFYAKVQSEIDELDDVDIKIMMIHWGNEYWLRKNDHQKRIAGNLSEMGFDVILGSHPHVIEEIEWIDDTLVVYSMGNFISNQSSETTGRPHTEDGMILHFETSVDRYGLKGDMLYSVIPTWVDKYSDGQYRVVPVNEGYVKGISDFSVSKYILSLERHADYFKDSNNFFEYSFEY